MAMYNIKIFKISYNLCFFSVSVYFFLKIFTIYIIFTISTALNHLLI